MKSSSNRKRIYTVSVTTAAASEEAVSKLLAQAYGQPVSSYTDLDTGESTVTAWFSQKLEWTATEMTRLRRRMLALKRGGLGARLLKIRFGALRSRDWADAWKHHFKPIRIGGKLLIKPSWSEAKPRKGEAVVVLDPGLSFGTGHHPTTAFCLEQVAAQAAREGSLLDLGTGSGILAIAGAKLGYHPIRAIDNDPQAVRVARANARRNLVQQRIEFACRGISDLSRRVSRTYSLVCANLLASILIEERDRILAHLSPNGVLVLAGILRKEFGAVRDLYATVGLRLIASSVVREWRSGAFAWHSRGKAGDKCP